MNRKIRLLINSSIPVLLAFLISGCMKDKITKTYKISTPIYETLTKFREGIKSQPSLVVSAAGKITVAGRYIFLSEPSKGIHVIDNINPPVRKMSHSLIYRVMRTWLSGEIQCMQTLMATWLVLT